MNIQGIMQLGKRATIEAWMKENNIHIMTLQETHSQSNTMESRQTYGWYFSGNESGQREWAGVATVIDPKCIKYIAEAIPVSPRIQVLVLGSAAPTTIINVYAPQAGKPEHEKKTFYKQLMQTCSKCS